MQILQTNTRLSKLAAAQAEFEKRGMFRGDVLTAAQREVGLEDDNENEGKWSDDGDDVGAVEGGHVPAVTKVSKRPGQSAWHPYRLSNHF